MCAGERGGRTEVYADSVLGTVCETGLDFTGGMKWVSRSRRMRTNYVMPKSLGVKYPESCYEVHTTRVAWTADEINCDRKFWGRKDEQEVVPERWRANESEEQSGKHEVVKRGDNEKRAASAAPVAWRKPEEAAVSLRSRRGSSRSSWTMCLEA